MYFCLSHAILVMKTMRAMNMAPPPSGQKNKLKKKPTLSGLFFKIGSQKAVRSVLHASRALLSRIFFSFLMLIPIRGLVRLEGTDNLRNFYDHIGSRKHDHPACSTLPQPTALMTILIIKPHDSEVKLYFWEPKCCVCTRGPDRREGLLKTYTSISALHRGGDIFYALFMRETPLHVSSYPVE
jgi:hypothetical protein